LLSLPRWGCSTAAVSQRLNSRQRQGWFHEGGLPGLGYDGYPSYRSLFSTTHEQVGRNAAAGKQQAHQQSTLQRGAAWSRSGTAQELQIDVSRVRLAGSLVVLQFFEGSKD
jgi:hypothetical protein